jgi:hypothetical protein
MLANPTKDLSSALLSMSLEYNVTQAGSSYKLSLLVEAEEYIADGPPNFWRVTIHADLSDEDNTASGPILCMKCDKPVELRPKDLVLWCDCTECQIINIEDTLNDMDDADDIDENQ